MGWKLAAVISQLEGRTLKEFVDEVYGGPQTLQASAVAAFDVMHPDSRERFALAHDGFGWIFDGTLAERSFTAPLPVRFPTSTFILHSVTGLYGYSTHANGAILRSRSGSSEERVHGDIGTPSDAEIALVTAGAEDGQAAWNAWCEGANTFMDGECGDELDTKSGEEIVFGLINALTGVQIDSSTPKATALHTAHVAQIVRPLGPLARLLGRG